MIKSFIEQNVEQLKAEGYDVIVQPIQIGVAQREEVVMLGGDRYILVGCKPSSENVLQDTELVTVASPNTAVSFHQREVEQLGVGIFHTFVDSIVISTFSLNGNQAKNPQPYILNFIKITPIRK